MKRYRDQTIPLYSKLIGFHAAVSHESLTGNLYITYWEAAAAPINKRTERSQFAANALEYSTV